MIRRVTGSGVSERSLLNVLTRERLVALGLRVRRFHFPPRTKKSAQIESLTSSDQLHFAELLRVVGDELRAGRKPAI